MWRIITRWWRLWCGMICLEQSIWLTLRNPKWTGLWLLLYGSTLEISPRFSDPICGLNMANYFTAYGLGLPSKVGDSIVLTCCSASNFRTMRVFQNTTISNSLPLSMVHPKKYQAFYPFYAYGFIHIKPLVYTWHLIKDKGIHWFYLAYVFCVYSQQLFLCAIIISLFWNCLPYSTSVLNRHNIYPWL